MALVLLALAACRGEVHTDLNVSTVSAAAAGQSFKVPARLGIEVGTEENCAAYQIPLMIALDQGFGDSRFLLCRHEGDTWFADYQVDLLVTPSTHIRSPLAVVVTVADGTLSATLAHSQRQIDIMTAALPRNLRRAMDGPLQPDIHLRLHNDTRSALTVNLPAAVVNGHPNQRSSALRLGSGGTVSLGLSNLGNAALYHEGSLLFWWAKP